MPAAAWPPISWPCAGLKVLVLEAGRSYDPVRETPMFKLPREAPLRGAGTREKPFGFYDATVDGGWEVPGEPYTNAPGTDFRWWRARMLGGRTNHWGRISLRMGEYDFKPKTRDGLGADWPLTYKELAPYYDRTEMLIGVYGGDDDLENTPRSSPGRAAAGAGAARRRAAHEEACDADGHSGDSGAPRDHDAAAGRRHAAAEDSSRQRAGAARAARLDAGAPGVLLGHALRQRLLASRPTSSRRRCCCRPRWPPGNLDIVPDAMVREVTRRAKGKATGVNYIDKRTRTDRHVKARVVVLAASACETARILLNSKSPHVPGRHRPTAAGWWAST